MLLYPKDGRLTFVLTRRTETVLNHKGQVSFPGGAQEEGDASLAETAMREAEEELGITLQDAEMLGALTCLYIAPSNYDVHPFVAHMPYRPDFHPFAAEVAELLEIPLSDLLDSSRFREEVWLLRGREVIVPFFLLGGHKVWGATSMILNELATMLNSLPAESEIENSRAI